VIFVFVSHSVTFIVILRSQKLFLIGDVFENLLLKKAMLIPKYAVVDTKETMAIVNLIKPS